MCCCCPPAISALFCLWIQSGCSKDSVAGALTFFPPEPALYEFERYNEEGEAISDVEAEQSPDSNANDLSLEVTDKDGQLGEQGSPDSSTPLECNRKGETKERMQSPAQQLVERAQVLRKRAKQRNERDARDAKNGIHYKLLLDNRLAVPPYDESSVEAVKIPAKKDIHVAAVIYRVPQDGNQQSNQPPKTIIYSHGNATDAGAMFPLQVVLAHSLVCNVVMYDYSGYGESGGVPMESNTYRDIEAVYKYTLEHVANNDPRNIILYGQSVGSGPCCHLARNLTTCGGMILHSPFTSGMRVLTPSRLLACLDIYPNIDRIKKVKCPVMVIHGRLDEEVEMSHGIDLHEAVPTQYQREPWWVSDRGHNDITEGPGKLAEYLRRLRNFLTSLD